MPKRIVDKTTKEFKMRGNDIADWIDMKYIVERTRCITQLIYFPFLTIALLAISRSQLFDHFSVHWTLPIPGPLCRRDHRFGCGLSHGC